MTLYPSLLSRLILLPLTVAAALFVGRLATAIAAEGGWQGWLALAACAAGAVFAVVYLLPGNSFLRLDADGFTIRAFYRTRAYRWADIEGFKVVRAGRQGHLVVFSFVPGSPPAQATGQGLASFTLYGGVIPDNYGLSDWELANLLNRHLEQSRRPAV